MTLYLCILAALLAVAIAALAFAAADYLRARALAWRAVALHVRGLRPPPAEPNPYPLPGRPTSTGRPVPYDLGGNVSATA